MSEVEVVDDGAPIGGESQNSTGKMRYGQVAILFLPAVSFTVDVLKKYVQEQDRPA
jgi:hypothetical protein